jgi:hypothetical protein
MKANVLRWRDGKDMVVIKGFLRGVFGGTRVKFWKRIIGYYRLCSPTKVTNFYGARLFRREKMPWRQ